MILKLGFTWLSVATVSPVRYCTLRGVVIAVAVTEMVGVRVTVGSIVAVNVFVSVGGTDVFVGMLWVNVGSGVLVLLGVRVSVGGSGVNVRVAVNVDDGVLVGECIELINALSRSIRGLMTDGLSASCT